MSSKSVSESWLAPGRSSPFQLYVVVLCICLLILAAAGFEVIQLRTSVKDQVQEKTQDLAISVTQTMDGLIDMIDVALMASVDEIARQRASKTAVQSSISKYLVTQATRLPHIAYLRGTDAEGNLVYGPGVSAAEINLSDREFFVAVRDNAALGLYMAKPVTSKMSGRALITFARRVTDPDGSFGGTVFSSIYLDELKTILSTLEINLGGSIALRDRDQGLIARHVFGAGSAIPLGDAHLSTPFRDALQINSSVGTYVSDKTSLDEVLRIYSYRRSSKYGYTVVVGEQVESAYANAQRQAAMVFALAALLCLAIALFARRVIRSRSILGTMVSELAESNKLVQQQEKSHRTLLQNLHTGLVVHAADGQITFCNAQASKLLGLTEQQMRGKTTIDPAWRFVDLDGKTMTVEDYPVSRVIASKQVVEHQVLGVQVPENADLVWLDVNVFPEFEESGALKQMVANFHDITELIQAEQARKRVSRSLRLLSDTNMAIARNEQMQELLEDVCRLICEKGGHLVALVGFARVDAQQSVQVVAQSGLDEIQLSQVRISWNESSEYGKGTTGTAISSGKTHINRDSDLNPDMTRWHEKSQQFGFRSSIAIPFVKKSGQRGALMLYAKQTDAFKSEEVELLEELVVNLAHGLDALDDQKRRIEAESATRAKANFLANMSHEIRTPLNAITGMAHLIRRDGITPSQAIKLDKLESASKHLLSIITDILDLSKIDAGKMSLEEVPVRGEVVVSNVLSMLIERAQMKNITLRSEVASLPKNLAGDFTRMQQALVNYVTNAIKFTESGAVTIRASVQEESDESALLRFEVADSGIGLDPSTLGRLFSEFEQADNTSTRKYGGTGLGLAITRKLAQLMGGDAGADSQLGVGSTFWFTARLRKHEEVVDVRCDHLDTDKVMEILRTKYAGLRVLVVEDEPVNAEIECILLEDIGFVVDTADDGQEALERAGRNSYELFLMDLQMPRMGGLDATRAIRKLPGYAKTPIIACTANAFEEDRMRCTEAGMTGFITKPTLPDKLYAAIFEVLENGPKA